MGVVVGLVAGPTVGEGLFVSNGLAALLFYLVIYGVMNLGAFAIIGVLLFSAFFTNLRGPWDSVTTYVAWGKKALGEKEVMKWAQSPPASPASRDSRRDRGPATRAAACGPGGLPARTSA